MVVSRFARMGVLRDPWVFAADFVDLVLRHSLLCMPCSPSPNLTGPCLSGVHVRMVEPSTGNDRQLSDRIIQGVLAFGELQDRFRRKLELHLLSHCSKSDGRSQEKAIEVASQVLSDCFAKSPSLLEKWQGNDNLEAFLRTVAHRRLLSWWESRDAATEVDSESRSITEATAPGSVNPVEWKELQIAGKALRAGVAAATRECPEGLVFLRLKGLHGVDQRSLSMVWGHHEAQTSRRIKEAMSQIRETAAHEIETAGHEIDVDCLQSALQADPSILLGSGEDALDHADMEMLRLLAGGSQDRDLRKKVISLMCRSSSALGFFAQLMNRQSAGQAVFVKDPALDGVDARLTECMHRTVEILRPSEARGLVTPLMSGLFADALRSIGADGGTLWLLSPGESMLEAVFNPLESEIAGKRQPLVSGIVSLCLATSETIRVDDAEQNRNHSSAIDIALGKTTKSMIAVPFRLMDTTRGVVTAVRFGGFPFGAADAEAFERQAKLMSSLFQSCLQSRIME